MGALLLREHRMGGERKRKERQRERGGREGEVDGQGWTTLPRL